MNWKNHKQKLLKNPAFRQALADSSLELAVARMLIEARLNNGISQQTLAKRLGTTQSVISRYERGTSLPSLTSLKKIAESLDRRLLISLV